MRAENLLYHLLPRTLLIARTLRWSLAAEAALVAGRPGVSDPGGWPSPEALGRPGSVPPGPDVRIRRNRCSWQGVLVVEGDCGVA
jgi:hypothetical protein